MGFIFSFAKNSYKLIAIYQNSFSCGKVSKRMIKNLNIITLAILIFSIIRVILSHNPIIHYTLFLILSSVTAAGIFLVLKLEFIALILIIVYAGVKVVPFLVSFFLVLFF